MFIYLYNWEINFKEMVQMIVGTAKSKSIEQELML